MNHAEQPLLLHLADLGQCRACPAMASTPVVSPPVHSKVIIVGQAPGVREPELKRPFAWTAGKTLFKWLESVSGADEAAMRQAVYFAAVCRCFPGKGAKGGGDRVPNTAEIENCSSWMRAEFDLLQPDFVIPVGKLGIGQFLEFNKLTEVIGRDWRREVFGRTVDIIPLPHPSGVSTWFRTEPGKSLTEQALQKIGDHAAFAVPWKCSRLDMSTSSSPAPGEISLTTPVAEATGKRLTKKHLSGLDALGIATVGDLITHYPRRYEDRTHFGAMPTGPSEVAVCLKMEVVDTAMRRLGGRRTISEAVVDQPDGGSALGGTLVLRWFNMPFMSKVIAVGQELVVYGKTKQSGRRLVMDHPDIEIIDPDDPEALRIHLARITPVYPLASGINQRTLRAMMFEILERLTDDALPDLLDPRPASAGDLWRGRALRQIHFPDSDESLAAARRFLALEEFVALQLLVLQRRAEFDAKGGVARPTEGLLLKDLLDSLPFQLTGAQQRCVDEIRADLAAPRPMNRLLQGDVGSGKTLVALSGMLLAVEAGYQAALMAPTQILAEQHYLVIHRLLEPLDIRVSLRTSAKQEDGFLPLMSGGDAPQIIIGTHALIHDKVEFEKLGFVVIDEQHKFGVAQRSKLIDQGHAPDVLVMTATPIPRTLTLSIYGDLDVSIIDELPAGRGKIITGIRGIDKTEKAAGFIRDQLEENRQAYIVYPLIEESEKLKSLAASVEFDKWAKRFEHFECGLIHGRMPAPEKEQVMKDFRDARLDVLIATTVIEVGVDVPNANVMLIYNAERFGLAQLHQLRGRVGRGAHKSYCVLMVDPKKTEAMEKLRVMEETIDGFKIADADLKMRGPGEVLGTAQSGLPDLKLGDLVTDTELVKEARELAADILRRDPQLTAPNHRLLAERFARHDKDAVRLS